MGGEQVPASEAQQVSGEWAKRLANVRSGADDVDMESMQAQGLPWRQDYEEPRVIRDAAGRMIGSMDTAEAAALVVESANAGDVDARREVTRLRDLVGHYRNRMQMTPSERQSYLDEDVEQSIQPERYYMETRERPITVLLDGLYGALVTYQVAGERSSGGDVLIAEVRSVIDRFQEEARAWLR